MFSCTCKDRCETTETTSDSTCPAPLRSRHGDVHGAGAKALLLSPLKGISNRALIVPEGLQREVQPRKPVDKFEG